MSSNKTEIAVSIPADPCVVYSIKELNKIFGFHEQTIWKMCRRGQFPKPVKLGPMTTRWRATDIAAWIDLKAQESAAGQSEQAELLGEMSRDYWAKAKRKK